MTSNPPRLHPLLILNLSTIKLTGVAKKRCMIGSIKEIKITNSAV
jgi:hypothetical protein